MHYLSQLNSRNTHLFTHSHITGARQGRKGVLERGELSKKLQAVKGGRSQSLEVARGGLLSRIGGDEGSTAAAGSVFTL